MAESDWSAELMSEELTLKVRRSLVLHLQDTGLWIPRARQRFTMTERRMRGEAVQREVLAAALGAPDHAYLRSEASFGAGNHRLRRDLPRILAFGYDVGACFHAFLGGDPAGGPAAASTCALFNAGIVLFDRVCDDVAGGVAELSRAFDGATMERLADDPRGAPALLAAARAHPSPEIRILLKVVSAFYTRARDAAARPLAAGDTGAFRRLNELLLQAYGAQIRAAGAPPASGGLEAVEAVGAVETAARAKSILPFEVMLQVAALGDAAPDPPAAARALARDVGTVFWLADDLVDLCKDLRTHSANALLCEARRTYAITARSPDGDAHLLRRLLEGPLLDQAVERLGSSLASVARALDAAPSTPRFRDLLAAYVGVWI